MILAILFAYFGYKKGNESGRNGIVWAFILLGIYLGTQFLVGILVGIFALIGETTLGWTGDIFTDYEILVNITAIIAAIGGSMLVLKYLDSNSLIENTVEDPPPPPEFNGN